MEMLYPLFVLAIVVVGVESLSLVKKDNSILDVTIDCGANKAANSPVLNILTDVDISAVAKCKNGEQSFTTADSVHFTLPAALTPHDSLCELNEKEGSDNFDIEVEVHYGEADGLILTKTKMITVVCTYSGYGKDDSPEHTVGNGPQANIERQTIVGGTVPSSDLTLSIQTVDDQDAVGPIAFDRRYSLFGSYTGAVPNVGLKPVSCDAISDDGERYTVLVAGCGDGFIFDRTDGFVTTGKTFRSPYFFAFHLADSGNLAFDCNVTLCSPSCEGSSCETVCGTVTAFPVTNGQLDSCTGNNRYQDTCTFVCDAGYDQAGVGMSTCGADGIWTIPQIVCTPKDCGAVPQGTLSTGTASTGTTYPKIASYICNTGHEVASGSAQISCLATGQWGTDVLVCEPKDCGAIPQGTLSSGTASSGTTYNNVADYICNEGHELLSGNAQISCLASGQWDVANVLVCQPKDCGAIPQGTLSSGSASSGTTYNNVADYICNEGHELLSGNAQISCLASGQWDVANVLVCQPKDCGAFPQGTLSSGTASSGTTYNNVADYICNEGHELLSGNAQISCLASGQWDVVNVLVCQPKDCGAIPQGTLSSGSASSGTTYDNVADYICNEGHELLSGNAQILCLASGQWDVANVLVCQPKDCGSPTPGTSSTGTASSGTTLGNQATYSCDVGYEVASGNAQISCLATGQWDMGSALVCQAKDCGAFPQGTLSSGSAPSGTTYNNVADYICNEGHELLSGNAQILCLASGQWDAANVLVCQPKDCGAIPQGTLSSGTASSGTTYNNVADYICNEGHELLSGNAQISCLPSGQWDVANVLVCQPKDCGSPTPGTSSTGTASSGTTLGNQATYSCDVGYEVASGNAQISCLPTGQWDMGSALVCQAKDCGVVPPGTLSSGTASSGTTYDNVADYTCNVAHEPISGNAQISCLASGMWDSDLLVCELCDVIPTGNLFLQSLGYIIENNRDAEDLCYSSCTGECAAAVHVDGVCLHFSEPVVRIMVQPAPDVFGPCVESCQADPECLVVSNLGINSWNEAICLFFDRPLSEFVTQPSSGRVHVADRCG